VDGSVEPGLSLYLQGKYRPAHPNSRLRPKELLLLLQRICSKRTREAAEFLAFRAKLSEESSKRAAAEPADRAVASLPPFPNFVVRLLSGITNCLEMLRLFALRGADNSGETAAVTARKQRFIRDIYTTKYGWISGRFAALT